VGAYAGDPGGVCSLEIVWRAADPSACAAVRFAVDECGALERDLRQFASVGGGQQKLRASLELDERDALHVYSHGADHLGLP
jgi:hypothetical protein